MNTFGRYFRVTTFGESHGPAMGGVIDGVPAGQIIDIQRLRLYVGRRAPGGVRNVSQRREPDACEFLSGLMAVDDKGRPDGSITSDTSFAVTLGTPIGFIVRNTDSRSGDYDELREVYRPSHADYTWEQKFGLRDWRGGGRASGRETVSRVVAGAIAGQLLELKGIRVKTELAAVGSETNPDRFRHVLDEVSAKGDSVGGRVRCSVRGLPVGVGEPVFSKLQSALAAAMLSIGGVKGFEYGDGFAMASALGSEMADQMVLDADDLPSFLSNHSGGIQGGISNGMPVEFTVAFKPTPSISGTPLKTINTRGEGVEIVVEGRHDPCIAVRGRIVVEAMTHLTIMDSLLASGKF